MKIIKIKDRHGNLLDHDASQPIPDYCGIVTNLMIMDFHPTSHRITITIARHHHRFTGPQEPDIVLVMRTSEATTKTEAAAQASYAASKARLADAWRGPS